MHTSPPSFSALLSAFWNAVVSLTSSNFIDTPVRDKKKIKKAPVVPFFQYVLAEPPACCQRNNMP